MAINSAANLLSVDSLFTTQAQRDEEQRESVRDIPLSEISDFSNHPFKVRMDESMTEMTDSVRRYGVLVPGLVRPKPDGGYEMVAGHRRKKASELAGLETVPCIVRELTDDEATIIMVDSNLQREQILPSEKAFAYKMRLEAMKRQGQRSDLTSAPVEPKLKGIRSNEESLTRGNCVRMKTAAFRPPPLHTSPPQYLLYQPKNHHPQRSQLYRRYRLTAEQIVKDILDVLRDVEVRISNE